MRVVKDVLLIRSVRILGCCITPNHGHFVVWPAQDDQVSAFMRQMTSTHAHRWQKAPHGDGVGDVYQGPFQSFPVESDEHLDTVCGYVERNRVRAGLVERAEAWVSGQCLGSAASRRSSGPVSRCMARRPTNRLAGAREPTADRRRTRGATPKHGAWSALWQPSLAGRDSQPPWARGDAPLAGTPAEKSRVRGARIALAWRDRKQPRSQQLTYLTWTATIIVPRTVSSLHGTRSSWDWREVCAPLVVMAFIIGAYLYFTG